MKKILNWLKAVIKKIFLQRDTKQVTKQPLVKQHKDVVKQSAKTSVEIVAAAKISEEIYKRTQLGQDPQTTQVGQNQAKEDKK